MGKEITVSASKLKTAEECQLKFNNSYVNGHWINGYVFPGLVIGNVFHQIVQWSYNQKKYKLQDLFGFIDKSWAIQLNDPKNKLRPLDLTPEKIQDHKNLIKKHLKNFYEYHVEKELLGVPAVGIEQAVRINWTTNNGKPVVLNGYIDRIMIVDDKAVITDWKTAKKEYIPSQEEVDKDVQLTFYSAFYRYLAKNKVDKSWPRTEEYLELFFTTIGEPKQTTRNKEHFDDLKNRVGNVVDLMTNGKKKASPSKEPYCKFCGYFGTTLCPETIGEKR